MARRERAEVAILSGAPSRFSNEVALDLRGLPRFLVEEVRAGFEPERIRRSALPLFGFAAYPLLLGSVLLRRN